MGPLIDENKLQFDEKKTKENIEIYLKMFIINFKNIRFKLTAFGKINHLIVKYKLKRHFNNLRLPKEQKKAKTANSRKKLSEKMVEGIKKGTFHKKTFLLLSTNILGARTTKFEKTRIINATEYISFQRKPVNTPNYATM